MLAGRSGLVDHPPNQSALPELMMEPFFSIITRTMPGRAALLERCQRSVSEQTFTRVEHMILRDEVGVGVAVAQKMLWDAQPQGEYVFVLDDDDYLSANDVLDKLHLELILAKPRPPFAVVKVSHGDLGMMPLSWQGEGVPREGWITVSNVVVENAVWHSQREHFGERYAGDYDFAKSLFDSFAPIWIDLDLVTVEKRRLGEAA